ncbi:MAG: methyltransferase domain-containing protein [Aromatoleum sp.]|jgi:phosphatidylethanolamine/phosphatidyl-N-methylethanolamine N-methyltransferase|uniref:class I SAM-dependent methyltransferase n=1 Tax=Aromatoleum sp. TaxID=2307007 RepID=UPI002895231B|nr:methyltransferase domain-containing protein [Aromatoleum sp.]MDT3669197.1 methyltransferase domain-containing protein [Aromatoleum sp.]
MDQQAITAAYRRYAPVYDVLFGPVFEPGRRRLVEALNCRPGDEILEVGVGTGLSLPYYPRHANVTGIDLSPHMLARANIQVRRHALRNVALMAMDVQRLSFPDASFDKVSALYVASVVPDPAEMMQELERVCRPGGEVVIVNHFTRKNGVVARIERGLAPLARSLGFRPLFPLDAFIGLTRLELTEATPVNAFGYWTLLRFRNPS